jgi:translation initiation factor eIF-2B subunit delta
MLTQERQRAEKEANRVAGNNQPKGGKQQQPNKSAEGSSSASSSTEIRTASPPTNTRNMPPKPFDDPKKKSKVVKSTARTLAQKPVPLFSHLRQFEKENMEELHGHGSVHPAIINLGIQFSEFIITGGSARCLAMLNAFKKVLWPNYIYLKDLIS